MMAEAFRPHLLGIDDGSFDRHADADVPVVAVLTEGPDLVEGVAITRFPVDGADPTTFLADWIGGLRFAPAVHAVVLGSVTIAGLAVVDVVALAQALSRPVIVVNRRRPDNSTLNHTLKQAGFGERTAMVDRTPPARQVAQGLFVSHYGTKDESVDRLLQATTHKSQLPEPLRLAHLIGAAVASGSSRGRP